MNINNFTDFYNLIKSCGLQSVSPFNNFISTVEQYVSICECDNPSLKAAKLADSINIYESIISGAVSSYINTFKSKKSVSVIHFYNRGRLVRTY